MNVETLEKRISSAEDKLNKLNKKLERILKAEESNYEENNPYYYNEHDKKYTLRDIEELESKLANYRDELETEKEKEGSRNIPAIIEFLSDWEERVYTYISNGLEKVYNWQKELKALYPKYGSENYDEEMATYKEEKRKFDKALYGECEDKNGRKIKVRTGELEWVYQYMYYNLDESLERLSKMLKNEKQKKYDFIIERTNKIVGEITDATNLRVGEKGDLNGIIIGTRGKASVNTIGAGGYNIQIYHFRTLIKEIK